MKIAAWNLKNRVDKVPFRLDDAAAIVFTACNYLATRKPLKLPRFVAAFLARKADLKCCG